MARSPTPVKRAATGKNVRAALAVLIILMALVLLPVTRSASNPALGNVSASRQAFNSLTGQLAVNYSWSGPTNGSATLAIVNASGRIVRAMDTGPQSVGQHSITWNGRDGNGTPVSEGRYKAWLLYSPGGSTTFSYRQPFVLPNGIENVSVNVTVDNTPPYTNVTLSGERGGDGTYTAAAEARLNATDRLSGVNVTEYSLDGAPWERYNGTITIGDGDHTLAYHSIDRAGNGEAQNTVPVNVSIAQESQGPDMTAPRVISTIPADGDDFVPTGRIISAWFDRDMDGSTINTDSFRLRDENGEYVVGTVDYQTAAVFVPDSPLTPYIQYTAVIKNAADMDGNQMDGEYTWSFIVGEDPSLSGQDGESYDNVTDEPFYLDNASLDEQVVGTGGDIATVWEDNMTTMDEARMSEENIADANLTEAGVEQSQPPFPGAYAVFVLPFAFIMVTYWLVRRKK